MRSVYYGDVSATARVLLNVPPDGRELACRTILDEAEFADRFQRRLGRVHPIWGNGTLRAAALRRRPGSEPTFDNLEYCACFELVLRHLRARHSPQVV